MAEYVDLLQIKEDVLDMGDCIGIGGFGVVYQATHRDWRQKVAVKKYSIRVELTKSEKEAIIKEAKILASVNHDNVVRLYGVCVTKTYYGLVTDYMVHGALIDLLKEADIHLPYLLRCKFLAETCAGMNFLHKMGATKIYHCDLKTANLLIDDHCTIKIADFGLSETQRVSQHKTVKHSGGTITHIPPENLTDLECPITEKFDVFSFGIVTWEVLSRELPYSGAPPNSALIALSVSNGQRPNLKRIPADAPQELLELMQQCWSQDPKDRPEFYDILPTLRRIIDDYEDDIMIMITTVKREMKQKRKSATGGDSEKKVTAVVPAVRKKQPSAKVKKQGAKSHDKDGGKQSMARKAAKSAESEDVDSIAERFYETLTLGKEDIPVKVTVKRFGKHGDKPGEYNWPWGITTTADNYIVICDRDNRRLQIIDWVNQCQYIIPLNFQPLDVAVSSDTNLFYITGWDRNSEVRVYDKTTRKVIFSFGQQENIKAKAIFLTSEGFLYITDDNGDCVRKYSLSGEHIKSSTSLGQNSLLWSLVVNTNNQVFVSDFQNKCIYVLNQQLETVKQFGTQQLQVPVGICLHPHCDVIYVSDSCRVAEFTCNGEFVRYLGEDQLSGEPFYIAITQHKPYTIVVTLPVEDCIALLYM